MLIVRYVDGNDYIVMVTIIKLNCIVLRYYFLLSLHAFKWFDRFNQNLKQISWVMTRHLSKKLHSEKSDQACTFKP